MVITYFGHEFFKIQQGDLAIAYNPISKDSKLKGAKFGADIAVISIHHEDMNGLEQVTYGEREPLRITGPGEYESRDVYIKGFLGKTKYGGKDARNNTIYHILLEGVTLVFLGALDSREIAPAVLEEISGADILFIPVGGKEVLSPADAAKLVSSIEPKIIIPMHYDSASLKQFLKEMGEESVKPEEKLAIKKKDLEGKEGDVVILKES